MTREIKNKILSIDTKWFFTELPNQYRFFLFFVRGDLIILLPFLILILLLTFFSIKFMVVMLGVFIAVRYFGEMIYWFAHQFYKHEYRPHDMGFKKLDNHAVYILYQTMSIVGTTVGIGIVIAGLLFMK
jgi:hypothetical protein